MAFEFRFPDVGEGITEGHLIKWLVKEGQAVKADQPIAEVETDKAVVELPAPVSGKITGLHAKPGQAIKVGALLVTIAESGEKIGKPAAEKKIGEGVKKAARKESVAIVGELPTKVVEIKRAVAPARAEAVALPAVRKLAKELGVDISKVQGTGAGGRVTEDDVRKTSGAVAGVPTPAAEIPTGEAKITFNSYGRVLWVPISPTRKAIIKRVTAAHTVPIACGMVDADITELAKVKEKEAENAKNKGVHLTLLPFVVRAVVAALKKHPYVNSEIDLAKGVIMNKSYYNIGIAVETAHGLMAPVIKNADSKSILEIAHDIEVLADGARNRTIALDDLKGSTFSITNYGSIAGNYAVPILNYPETAILGMGRAEDKAIVRNGQIVIRKILPLSLTFDHRVIDGAEAASFLKDVARHLEDPGLLLVDID